jgi:hypothetical protein
MNSFDYSYSTDLIHAYGTLGAPIVDEPVDSANDCSTERRALSVQISSTRVCDRCILFVSKILRDFLNHANISQKESQVYGAGPDGYLHSGLPTIQVIYSGPLVLVASKEAGAAFTHPQRESLARSEAHGEKR